MRSRGAILHNAPEFSTLIEKNNPQADCAREREVFEP
jgi:hypothetical protein